MRCAPLALLFFRKPCETWHPCDMMVRTGNHPLFIAEEEEARRSLPFHTNRSGAPTAPPVHGAKEESKHVAVAGSRLSLSTPGYMNVPFMDDRDCLRRTCVNVARSPTNRSTSGRTRSIASFLSMRMSLWIRRPAAMASGRGPTADGMGSE